MQVAEYAAMHSDRLNLIEDAVRLAAVLAVCAVMYSVAATLEHNPEWQPTLAQEPRVELNGLTRKKACIINAWITPQLGAGNFPAGRNCDLTGADALLAEKTNAAMSAGDPDPLTSHF